MLCCFRYHKGTDFQANHNLIPKLNFIIVLFQIPQRYRFSSKSQQHMNNYSQILVVLDTTKVQIFKQITTFYKAWYDKYLLFQIPQRYRFSSKSQRTLEGSNLVSGCFRYHKGTDFQANHNFNRILVITVRVVLDTTKVQIFKQITTNNINTYKLRQLFQIPQRYRFSSKSQQ